LRVRDSGVAGACNQFMGGFTIESEFGAAYTCGLPAQERDPHLIIRRRGPKHRRTVKGGDAAGCSGPGGGGRGGGGWERWGGGGGGWMGLERKLGFQLRHL